MVNRVDLSLVKNDLYKLPFTRSIRLNRSYRAIYSEQRSGQMVVIRVEEVNKHDY